VAISVETSTDLVTLTHLVNHLQRPAFDADEVRQAQQALDIAVQVVRSRTGQDFTAGTSTVSLPLPDDQWLRLPQQPVTAVTSVTLDGVAVTDFQLVNGRLFRHAGWHVTTATAPVVTVTYSHGGTVPDDVRGAALAVAADLFDNPAGLQSETIDGYTWRRSDTAEGLLAEQLLDGVVRAYRRRPLTVPVR
jgi:hypothetical protein